MGVGLLALYNVSVVSVVLKVGADKRSRLSCLKVLGDSESGRLRWSWGLVQVMNKETVEEVNAYVAEAGRWMSRFIQFQLTAGVCLCGHGVLIVVPADSSFTDWCIGACFSLLQRERSAALSCRNSCVFVSSYLQRSVMWRPKVIHCRLSEIGDNL